MRRTSGRPALSASFTPSIYQGRGALFVNPDAPLITAQSVNVDEVFVQAGAIALEDYLYLQHIAYYDDALNFRPEFIFSSNQILEPLRNRNQLVGISLNQGRALTPGLYWISLDPIPMPEYTQTSIAYAVVIKPIQFFTATVAPAIWCCLTTGRSMIHSRSASYTAASESQMP